MKQQNVIQIQPKVQVHEPVPIHITVQAASMACRSCGRTMRRGTQCERCGAWCR